MLDDRLLDLLERWEESASRGQIIDVAELAAGDDDLASRLRQHLSALHRMVWLQQEVAAGEELPIPSSDELKNALLLPDELDLATFQANLTKVDLPDPAALAALLKKHRVKNAYQLANLLLESELLTRFQLRAISRGRTRGLRLGRYVILDKIGEGGMGQVYKARHSRMDRDVAIKVLPREAMNKANGVERFYQEVQVAARLRHPNIVTAYDADEGEGLHFLVMEYVDGRDLSSIVHREGPLSPAKAVDCVLQAAQGLQYAHGVGLVHRDIKPANLLLNQAGVVKILDMGIARMQNDANSAGLTQNGTIMGTVDYMSPEQAIDAKTVTPQADLYSLGCTLYYLLTGRPPFGGDSIMAKLLCHREQSPPSLMAIRSDVSPALEAIYQKCVAKSPADRYASAEELIADLEQIRPQLSDAAAPLAYKPVESNVDTSSTGIFATMIHATSAAIPGLTIDPGQKSQPAPRRRGAAFYGGALVIGLLLGSVVFFGAGALFKLGTPNGTLVVEVDGEDYVAHLRGHELKLINEKTQDSLKITLLSTEETQSLPPGDYKFAVETSSGLKTNVSALTVTSGAESKVQVYWEDAAAVANIPAEPAPPVSQTPTAMATNPAPFNSPSSAPSTPAVSTATLSRDNDDYAQGEWVSLLTSQAEVDRLIAAQENPPADYEQATFSDGILTTKETNVIFTPFTAKNLIFRARVKRHGGSNGILRIKQGIEYGAFWTYPVTNFFIGKNLPGGGFQTLKRTQTPAAPPEFFEMAFVAIGRTLILYIDGKELFRLDRDEEPTDQVRLSIGTHRGHEMQFKEIQVMVLDDDVKAPETKAAQDPDYIAAKRILSAGGRVTVNRQEITSESQLPAPPFEIKSVHFVHSKTATDADLAPLANCRSVEDLSLFGCSNFTANSLSALRNCRNLRNANLNMTSKVGPGLVHLADCQQLEELQLWMVKVTLADVLPVADRKYKRLNLGTTAVTDDWLPYFKQVADLEFLNLRFTRVTDKGLAQYQTCEKINSLSLGRTGVTDLGFSYFKNCRDMELLIIAESAISDASVDQICSYKKLTGLEIEKTKITAAGVEKIRQALPRCKISWDGGTIQPAQR
ncbi:protein kinase [Blastopirellula sp. JC732]|uniref:non-specific serine/threonine protein kinase n=1 Tax=Blastopirellula sediminis TaxID=2894196 RepID=A0A9X1MKV1_9BACT|nr:protein kinase [Blastopirellula sediminis]MCC9607843.1 protein kinase [Blastopirellula sediminis]MCC9627364.1 protein kinase [Blastopirellula sediminis]